MKKWHVYKLKNLLGKHDTNYSENTSIWFINLNLGTG